MGSSLSCLKPQQEGGAIRPVVERRPVSATELQRPASSFTASNSLTLEERRRQSVDVPQLPSPNVEKPAIVESTNVNVVSAQRLLPTPRTLMNAVTEVEDVEEKTEAAVEDTQNEEELPNVGSTSEDVGATEHIEKETAELVDVHIRTEKALLTETATAEMVVETKLTTLPEKAPSLESIPASNGHVKIVPLEKEFQMGDKTMDRVTKKDLKTVGEVSQKKLELQRSDTMLDVRKVMPLVCIYEKLDAAAKVNDEELVKSGKFKTAEA